VEKNALYALRLLRRKISENVCPLKIILSDLGSLFFTQYLHISIPIIHYFYLQFVKVKRPSLKQQLRKRCCAMPCRCVQSRQRPVTTSTWTIFFFMSNTLVINNIIVVGIEVIAHENNTYSYIR